MLELPIMPAVSSCSGSATVQRLVAEGDVSLVPTEGYNHNVETLTN
jgi:hypothetical protein